MYNRMDKLIQSYQLHEKIGQGQYGSVYRAQHVKTKLIYAVKVMPSQKFKQVPKLTEFINNEIGILTKVKHVNIIKYFQMIKTPQNYYIVYEYCNGGNLYEAIKSKGKIPEKDALKIFKQLISAYQSLYQNKILHRDLKPHNILFNNGVVKIADFGFCKEMLKENDMTQTMVGSPIYMAPQLLKGMAYDFRADIWSLGIVFFQTLYGYCPFEQNSIAKLINLIEYKPIPFPKAPAISQNIVMLMKKILAIRSKERINPKQLFEYPIKSGDYVSEEKIKKREYTYQEASQFIRKAILYMIQTLDELTNKVDKIQYLRLAFLLCKIIMAIQKDTAKGSAYWQFLKITKLHQKWNDVLQQEFNILKPFMDYVKEVVEAEDTGLRIKLQLQTFYVNNKFFYDCIKFAADEKIQFKLLNCLLFMRHFTIVLENKVPDFTDPTSVEMSFTEKQQYCLKYAKYN